MRSESYIAFGNTDEDLQRGQELRQVSGRLVARSLTQSSPLMRGRHYTQLGKGGLCTGSSVVFLILAVLTGKDEISVLICILLFAKDGERVLRFFSHFYFFSGKTMFRSVAYVLTVLFIYQIHLFWIVYQLCLLSDEQLTKILPYSMDFFTWLSPLSKAFQFHEVPFFNCWP